MPKRRFAPACLVLATAGLLLAGCEASVSTGNQIDTEEVAGVIQDQYPAKADGLKMTGIECDGADAEEGAEFNCEATNEVDVELDIAATITEVTDEDRVNFRWDVARAVAPGAPFGEAAAVELQKIRAVASVECPDDIVIEKGTVVDCTATMDDGSKRKVKVTLTDGDGAFDADLLGPA